MQITLPESLLPWAERKAEQRGFSSLSDYVADLLAKDRVHEDPDDFVREALADDLAVSCEEISDDAIARRKSEIESKLLAALESGPPILVTDEFWAERRRILEQRIQAITRSE